MAIYLGNNSSNNIDSSADIIHALKGNDTVTATNTSAALVFGGDGNDVLIYAGSAAGGQSLMFGESGNDLLQGGANTDGLDGGSGADTLLGLGGDDVLEGSGGADVLNGGDGRDAATYILSPGKVRVDLADPAVNTGEAAGDSFISIENLVGSIFNDTLAGDTGHNILEGGIGADRLIGRDGSDTASYALSLGKVRADLLTPGSNSGAAAGDAYVEIENLMGSCFNDTLAGDNAGNVLEGGKGADLLIGRDGFDMAGYAFAKTGVRADLVTPSVNTGDAAGDTYQGIEGLLGSDYADTLAGNDASGQFFGGRGDDVVYGRGERDDIFGGDGADLLSGDDGNDLMFGDAGADTLLGGNGDDRMDGGLGPDRLEGGAGVDTAGYDRSTGAVRADLSGANVNTGDAAGDVFVGVENLVGSYFNDVLRGDNNENRIEGLSGDDVIIGIGDADTLIGGEGDDVINGQGGNDYLEGGSGDDTMSGGVPGRDYFVFHEYDDTDHPLWGNDVILDFEDGVDLIDFRNSVEYGDEITFASLTISQQGANVLIEGPSAGESILLLNRLSANITSSDFLF